MQKCIHCGKEFDSALKACPHCSAPIEHRYPKPLVKNFFYLSPYLWNFFEKTFTLGLSIAVFFIPMIAATDQTTLPLWDWSFSGLTSLYSIVSKEISLVINGTTSWTDSAFLSMASGAWVYLGFLLIEIFWFVPRWFVCFFALTCGNGRKYRHRLTDEIIAQSYHVEHDLGSLGWDKTLSWALITNAFILTTTMIDFSHIHCFAAFYSYQRFNMGTLLIMVIAGIDVLCWIGRTVFMGILKAKVRKAYRIEEFKPLKKLYTY